MDQHTTSLERAFELARSGHCRTVAEIRKILKAEGYSEADFVGKSLTDQLKALMVEVQSDT
ncbi:hypothetical protein [Methyloligella solikamskensis]|uniref:Uncharacterized protein n=1 Tax=Methyloligella solikamskensis TaxID=1177756 RepID=A0ABW3JD28_9HYPH